MTNRLPDEPGAANDDARPTEDSISEAEWKFRALFENGPIGVAYHRVVYDDKGVPVDYYFIDANQRYIELTGVDPRGKLVTEAFPGIEKDEFDWIGTFCRVGMTGESVRVQQHLAVNDRWYDLVGYQYKQDHFVGAFLDITDRMRAQEELKRSERRYRALFERTRDAIVVLEKTTGVIRDANAATEELTGRSHEMLVGNTVVDAGDAGAALRLKAIAEAGDEPFINHGRVIFRRPDDTTRVAILTTIPIDGDLIFGIAHDITDEMDLEARFRQAQKMEAVGHLAGGVAHDFNNILVPIIGYAELALTELKEGDALHPELTQIKKSAERAADLTRQILAFSRRQVLEMQVLDLGQVVEALRPMIGRLLPENITLAITSSEGDAPVLADRAQLEQIIMNLVVNASDAMPDGGELAIEIGTAYLDAAHFENEGVTPQQPGDYVKLVVRDSGHGMSPETRRHIFEPFFTTKSVDKGTGLGLSTVFGIVKQHEGFIWVDSEPDQGTAVTIYMPPSTISDKAAERSVAEPASLRGTETILVVEDEDVVRDLVRRTLRRFGYQVIDAAGPRQGLEVAAAYDGTIDLLLTDVIMPDLNGRQLYEQIIPSRPDLAVLYMSGYSDSVIAKHGVLDETVHFLQKPFTIEDLARRVRRVLG